MPFFVQNPVVSKGSAPFGRYIFAVCIRMKINSFLKNAATVTFGAFIAKGIGALYRIPLANALGGYGIGLYQMAYPFFCLLLTFSSSGIPNALARMISRERASGRGCEKTVSSALRLFSVLGLCGMLFMLLFARTVAQAQGDESLVACYLVLAPSVPLVALIAVFRGYFQGKKDMRPTALSEIFEQGFKALLGTYFLIRYQGEPVQAVVCSLLAVTLSELLALLFLFMRYRGEVVPRRISKRGGENILRSAFPVMLSAAILPLSQMADSVIIVRLLSAYTPRAIALYGLYTGGAVALVNLPVSVCYGLASASVPAVSEALARGDDGAARRRSLYALFITLLLSLPCAVGLFVLAKPAVAILYPALSVEDGQTLVSLVRLCALSAVTLSGVQTLSACLTGMGRAKRAAVSMAIAVFVKFVLQFLLLRNSALSIGGAAIASNACYLVAFLLNLFYTIKQERKKAGKRVDHHRQFRGRKRGLERASASGNSECGTRLGQDGAHRIGAGIARRRDLV